MRVRFAIALIAFGLVGCKPYLRYQGGSTTALEAPERCGQGPYTIEIPAEGARWGERVELFAYTPRPLDLRYEVRVGDGPVVASGRLRGVLRPQSATGSDGKTYLELRGTDESFDASPCVSSGAEAALRAAGGVGAGAPGGAPGVVGGGGAGGGPAEATVGGEVAVDGGAARGAVELQRVRWEGDWRLSLETLQQRGLGRTRSLSHTWTIEGDPEAPPPLEAGAHVRIRVWAERPNLLEGVTFLVLHRVADPSVSDEEYAAHLAEERREREEERAERERARRERAARGPTRRERRRARRAQRRAEEARERRAYCDAHREDESCWGAGGYEGHLRRQREAEARRAAAAAAQPDGPPPAPRAEVQPPKPSPNARWVPGYWHWAKLSGRLELFTYLISCFSICSLTY